jgi:PAS domain S-box-containing protein
MKPISEHILEQTGTLVVVLNEAFHADYVSPSVMDILGFTPDQLLGSGWLEKTRTHDFERAAVREHLLTIHAGDALATGFERSLSTAFGGRKHILWNAKKTNDGKLIGIGYDITERKHQEEQLLQKTQELDSRNKEVEASLRYAQRIQSAILPDTERLNRLFEDAFVYYKPKDIVSGDFWWIHEAGDITYVAVIDCTGHGVPGALMSVIVHSIFREVFLNKKLTDPAAIVYALDAELMDALNKEHGHQQYPDGMDVALCVVNRVTGEVRFTGALRPLWLLRDGQLYETAACKYPLGFYNDTRKLFTTTVLQAQRGDWLYLFSDGYADQFGGDHNKKLNKARFRELLLTASGMNGEEQYAFLDYSHRNWRQDEEQTDDVLVMGIQL